MYEEGLVGATEDYKEAAKWYLKAAEKGHAQAQYKMGTMYTLGKGVYKDRIEAAKWFGKAAQQGYEPVKQQIQETGDQTEGPDAERPVWGVAAEDRWLIASLDFNITVDHGVSLDSMIRIKTYCRETMLRRTRNRPVCKISHKEAKMLCPICNVDLLMTERQGIEIDYCPKCRGIWLDRGELEKIMERSSSESQIFSRSGKQ